MKNAGLYIRVSTERQALEGYSVAAQKANLSKFAHDNDFKVYGIYADEGISGKNIEGRPEVKRLIQDIENGKIDVVLIQKFDRLTRNITDTEDFIKLFQKYDVDVWSISDGKVDVSNSNGKFMTLLKGLFAQHERELTSERIKIAFKEKVKQGYTLCCNVCSYGYNRKTGQKVMSINQEEARVVKRIFRMYLDNYSFTDIAKALNLEHIPTKKHGLEVKTKDSSGNVKSKVINSVWQPKTVRLILSNPTYIGKVRYGINTKNYFEADGHHKPIVSQKTWDEVQNKLSKIKHVPHTNLPKDDVYFCGTLVCGVCGKKMTSSRTIGRTRRDGKHKVFNAYRCVNREKQLCTALGMSHSKAERAFLKYLENIEDFDTTGELVIEDESDELKEEIASIERVIQNSKNKLKEVMNMFIANAIDHDQLTYMSTELKKSIELNESRLKELQDKYQPQVVSKDSMAKSILEHWLFLTNREKLTFLNKFVEEIVIVNRINDRRADSDAEVLSVKFYDDAKIPSFY